MSCARKKELAEDSETLLAAAMDHKVAPVQLKGNAARTRPVKVVGKTDEVVKEVPLGKALDGVVFKEWILTATQDGVRPKEVLCGGCAKPVKVKRARVPKHCPACAMDRKREENKTNSRTRYMSNITTERERGREKQRARLEADPNAVQSKRRAYYEANAEKLKEKARRRRQEKRDQVAKEKRAHRARKKAEAAK